MPCNGPATRAHKYAAIVLPNLFRGQRLKLRHQSMLLYSGCNGLLSLSSARNESALIKIETESAKRHLHQFFAIRATVLSKVCRVLDDGAEETCAELLRPCLLGDGGHGEDLILPDSAAIGCYLKVPYVFVWVQYTATGYIPTRHTRRPSTSPLLILQLAQGSLALHPATP